MASPAPPVKVPDYIVGDKIGSGACGDVYKAYKKGNINKTETVAIKAVHRSLSSSVESLITEIKLLKKLNHPHIVHLRDFLCDENYVYIIMEYCSGGDLSHFIKSRHRLPEAACQRFLQQIASALKYIRDQDVSHFDLKPQNILLSSRKNPCVKIADFGLAQHLAESESISKVRGSPLYMAPEILLKKQYDAKVDLWSVGVILYESLFGKAPYSSATLEELITKIKTGPQISIPSNTNISSKCRDLLIRCLERDPLKRIEFEEFFNHPFVDLEHIPCPANLDKARRILKDAVTSDEGGLHEEALKLYRESLLYLVPAVHAEGDVVKKQALKKSVKRYLDRSYELKEILSKTGSGPPSLDIPNVNSFIQERPQSSVSDIFSELLLSSETTPGMAGAIDIGKSAELYEMEGNYHIALEKYELALGKLLDLLHKEPKGKRRDLLTEVTKRWMTKAEFAKDIIVHSQNRNALENSVDESSNPKKGFLKRFGKAATISPTDSEGSSEVLSEADYEKFCGIQ